MFCTGFNNLAYHSLNKGDIINDTCRLCGEDSEQAWHLATECPATTTIRLNTFGTEGITPNWKVADLLAFLARPAIEEIISRRVDGDYDYPTGLRDEGEN